MRGEVPESIWAAIESEFTLPSLERVQEQLGVQLADPEPVLRRLVRVFLGEGTYCPGFQFTDTGGLHPTVSELFELAMELKVPHNYFTPWMVTPSTDLEGSRPVDLLSEPVRLRAALEVFARR